MRHKSVAISVSTLHLRTYCASLLAVISSSSMDVSSSGSVAKDGEGYQCVIEDKESRRHPVEEANIIERWFFLWMTPLITIGSKKPLEIEDFPLLPQELRMNNLYDQINCKWKREVQSKKHPKFGSALWKAYWFKFFESASWNIPVESSACCFTSLTDCSPYFTLCFLFLHSTH